MSIHDMYCHQLTSLSMTVPIPSEPRIIDEVDVPRSIGRVLDLFEIVLAEGRCTLTTAATAAGAHADHRAALSARAGVRGYVDRDACGDFSAGPTSAATRRMGSRRHGARPIDLATQPHLDRLAERTGESAYLAVSDGRTGTYVATRGEQSGDPPRRLGGTARALDGTALGAALADPAAVVTRTGAVEPDITAMCRALPPPARWRSPSRSSGPSIASRPIRAPTTNGPSTRQSTRWDRELRINGEDFAS